MEDEKNSKPRKIRLTRTEAYAMQMSQPRKKKWTFALAGLLVIVILGIALWFFRSSWLPFWFPPEDAGPPAQPGAVERARTPAPQAAAPSEFDDEPTLDFLSAAAWQNPNYRQGVRLFNEALDQFRSSGKSGSSQVLAEVADKTRQAGRQFESLRPVEPENSPLDNAIARCRLLLKAVQEASRPATAASQSADTGQDALKEIPEFRAASRLYNQALEQFNQYKQNPSRTELLTSTEDMAREAGDRFQALKKSTSPSLHKQLDSYSHKAFGIVSACRGAQLKEQVPENSSPFDRGTAGPRRRPALPAYQSPES